MITYRITKYNPIFRNEKGFYPPEYDDWTDWSDIGKVFNAKKLTLEEYLNTEDKYVKAIKEILLELKIEKFRVINLSNFRYIPSKNKLHELDITSKFLVEKVKRVKEDEVIKWDLIEAMIRAILRGLGWCKLFHKNFIINFGYDLYMGVFTNKELTVSVEKINSMGLFVENLGCFPTKKFKRMIVSGLKAEEELLNDFSIDVSFLSLKTLRKIFNFSDEHPMDGFYKINSSIAEKMGKIIKYEFDLDTYDYFLEAEDY